MVLFHDILETEDESGAQIQHSMIKKGNYKYEKTNPFIHGCIDDYPYIWMFQPPKCYG